MWSTIAKVVGTIVGSIFGYGVSQNPNGAIINRATSGFKQLSDKLFDSDSANSQYRQNYVKGGKND